LRRVLERFIDKGEQGLFLQRLGHIAKYTKTREQLRVVQLGNDMAAVAGAKTLSRFIGECHPQHSDRAEDAAAVEGFG
jgi:hypothetical protein